MNPNIYITSDWHINEPNVLKFNDTPFKTLDEYRHGLVTNYNRVVRDLDRVYFLGDIANKKFEETKAVINQLKGTKFIVLGNHDTRGRQFWYNLGFTEVFESVSLTLGKYRVFLNHYPLYGIKREDTSKMKGCTGKEFFHGHDKWFKKGYLYNFQEIHPYWYFCHGHIHSPNSGQSVKILDRQFDCGVFANNFKLVSFYKDVQSWIMKHQQSV